jgi:micrococcal nuclease
MKKILLLPLLLFLSFAHAETFQCKVVGVTDGDTITCLTDQKKQVKVRLYQIDAPESGQAYGQKAKQALSDMIYGQTVTIENKGTDRYKRTLGVIWLENNSRITPHDVFAFDINYNMIKQGYAWYYPFTKKNLVYQQAEQEAKSAKRGLWADKHAMPPWAWRKQNRK